MSETITRWAKSRLNVDIELGFWEVQAVAIESLVENLLRDKPVTSEKIETAKQLTWKIIFSIFATENFLNEKLKLSVVSPSENKELKNTLNNLEEILKNKS